MKSTAIIFSIIISVFLCGCLSPEFQSFDPVKTGEYGPNILGKEQSGMWYWVRGRIDGDIDGSKDSENKKDLEEVLLVSQQSGPRGSKGRMEEAYIVICKRDMKTGFRSVVTRMTIHSSYRNIEPHSFPRTAVGNWPDQKFEGGRLKLADIDGDALKEVIASLWYKKGDGFASLHLCLKFHNNKLYRMMSAKALQNASRIINKDIDKDGIEELVVPVAIDSSLSAGKDSVTNSLMPEWPCIYKLTGSIKMSQKNSSFADYYKETQLSIYEDMALRSAGLPDSTRGAHQYYLGLIYSYKNKPQISNMFFKQSALNLSPIGKLAGNQLKKGSVSSPLQDRKKKPVAEFRDGPEL
ncbi:MAG: hypothetical protein ACYTFY_04210 [Planctomycetota bacterium]|jgi:hypothetical protein